MSSALDTDPHSEIESDLDPLALLDDNLEDLDDPSMESLDFFLRDFLGISERLVGDSTSSLWVESFSFDLLTLNPLLEPFDDFFDCLVFSGFSLMEVSAEEPVDAWRLDAFGTSGKSRAGELLALLLDSTHKLMNTTIKIQG